MRHEPYRPQCVLTRLDEGLWLADGPNIDFRLAGLSLPFPTRMTIVRLPDRGLWVHSPITSSQKVMDEVAALGTVRALVAPNTLHYSWLSDWAARFPDAMVYAPAPLQAADELDCTSIIPLRPHSPQTWSGSIDQVLVACSRLTEVVFFHRSTRTLIITDLIENFNPARIKPFWWRWLFRVSGATGSTPKDMRFAFRHNLADLRAAVEQMLAWQPTRVILAHGDWLEQDGTEELRRAFSWLLKEH